MRVCPFCGYEFHLLKKRKDELIKYNILRMRCNNCGKMFEVQRVNTSVYLRYNDGEGSVRERIGAIAEFI